MFVAAMLAAGLGAGAVHAAPDRETTGDVPQASIAFVNSGASVRRWQADEDTGIWVQDAHQQWYYASLIGPCQGLDFAVRIGFETRGVDTLDRFASVIVPGYTRCQIESFTRSEAPPRG
jgi:hypothetical protein